MSKGEGVSDMTLSAYRALSDAELRARLENRGTDPAVTEDLLAHRDDHKWDAEGVDLLNGCTHA